MKKRSSERIEIAADIGHLARENLRRAVERRRGIVLNGETKCANLCGAHLQKDNILREHVTMHSPVSSGGTQPGRSLSNHFQSGWPGDRSGAVDVILQGIIEPLHRREKASLVDS